jgi:uncharacterized lipoprotein NlpE involved in copper resistance
MRQIKYITGLLAILILVGCDNQGTYTFKVKNGTAVSLELRFLNETSGYPGYETTPDVVVLAPGEEKTVRIIYSPINSPVHDCLTEHGISYFRGIIFDTYMDGVKLERQLWRPENWTYSSSGKWSATYSMTIMEF